jgi:hypothetical protein
MPGFWTVDAAIARSRLPLAAALLNTLSKQRIPSKETGK